MVHIGSLTMSSARKGGISVGPRSLGITGYGSLVHNSNSTGVAWLFALRVGTIQERSVSLADITHHLGTPPGVAMVNEAPVLQLLPSHTAWVPAGYTLAVTSLDSLDPANLMILPAMDVASTKALPTEVKNSLKTWNADMLTTLSTKGQQWRKLQEQFETFITAIED